MEVVPRPGQDFREIDPLECSWCTPATERHGERFTSAHRIDHREAWENPSDGPLVCLTRTNPTDKRRRRSKTLRPRSHSVTRK